MKVIAAAVGAPVSDLKSCTPNIEIVFTTTPQDLLDKIRKEDPDYLGYAETSALREKLATVTHPVEARYTTETIDLNGMRRVDSARRLGTGITMSNFNAFSMPSTGPGNRDPIYLPDATYARVTGNHIDSGSKSGFNHIIVIVDSKKLAGQSFISLADYIAMLALTQLNSLDTCQQLPSIVNMLAPDCDQKVDGITKTDLAYLRGLYRMGSDKSLLFEQNDITDQMVKDAQDRWSGLAASDMSPTHCVPPGQPASIDGTTATLDQLKTSIASAKQFMAASDSYQDCLGNEMDGQKAAATVDKPFDKAIADRDLDYRRLKPKNEGECRRICKCRHRDLQKGALRALMPRPYRERHRFSP